MNSPTDSLIIREARDADISSLLHLYTTLETSPPPPSLEPFDPAQILDRMRHYPWHRIFVVVLDDCIVGSFTLTIIDYLAHRGLKTGIMEAVVVDPALRSQGIGSRMIAFCIECCREEGCYKLALSSNVSRTRAHEFYEREGFTLHGYSFAIPLRQPD